MNIENDSDDDDSNNENNEIIEIDSNDEIIENKETIVPVIETAYIELHTKLDNLPIEIFDYTENVFGVLKIKINPNEEIQKIEIKMDNGLIYDSKQNKWRSSIHYEVFTSDFEYIFFLKIQNPFNICANLYGVIINDSSENNVVELLDDIIPIPNLLNENGTIEENDLSKYIFHQKTEEIIYKTYSAMRMMRFYADYVGNLHYHKKIQNDIEKYFRLMHQYMRYNNLLEDDLMRSLCNEMKLVYIDLKNQTQINNDFLKRTQRKKNEDENEMDYENYMEILDDDIMIFLPEDEIYIFSIYN